jgi:hypothetical protein
MATATELPINTSATALDMANEIFGSGMVVNTATYSGDAASSGTYSNGDTVSPFATPGDTGVILSTGNVVDFTNNDGTSNTNQSGGTSTNTVGGIDGDADFNALATGSSFDAAFLEMTFTPTGDTLTLDFVLSSEEYPDFVNTAYNDVIGVWVNGTLATVSVGDGTASISNINNGETQNIFNDNLADQFNTEMDGFTVTLTFTAPITPGAINTLKIGVADVGDSGYDTNLLIAGGSVQSTIIAQDDTIIFGENDTKILDVLDNDSSTGGALTVTHINGQAVVASDPANNSITLTTGQIITLLPDGTFQIQGDADLETVYFNYSIEDAAGNTDSALVEVVQIPCFASGTTIETAEGPMLIENITAGMYVNTRDDGPQMVRWIGNSTVSTEGNQRPIRVKKGSFGATSDLIVSPQHRIMLEGCWAELLFGEPEVLVKAKDLINNFTVINDYELEQVTYHHMLFDRHQVITANGVACESYLPGDQTMAGFNHDTQKEILNLFPALREDLGNYGGAARPLIKGREALPLLAAMAA